MQKVHLVFSNIPKRVSASILAMLLILGTSTAHASLIFDIFVDDWTGANANIEIAGLLDNIDDQQATSVIITSSTNSDLIGLDFLIGGTVGAQVYLPTGAPISNLWSVSNGMLIPDTNFYSFYTAAVYDPYRTDVGTVRFQTSSVNASLFTEIYTTGPSTNYTGTGPFIGTPTPISEPGALALFTAGALAFGVTRRKQSKARK